MVMVEVLESQINCISIFEIFVYVMFIKIFLVRVGYIDRFNIKEFSERNRKKSRYSEG